MNDPHVKRLRYKLVTEPEVTFKDGLPPGERDLDGFSVRLADDGLTVTMHDHYATAQGAQAAVEPYLRAWRASAALTTNRAEFEFAYQDADVVDRSPDPSPGSVRIMALTASATASASVTLSVERGSYPAPPDRFALDPDTETLWNRWQGYIAGREPLQGMAYACLTMLEMHGRRSGAATRFAIARTVLDKVAHLSSETGDPQTIRKMTPNARPMTAPERAWLEATVKALVRRAGEVAAGVTTLPTITMGDLPEL